MASTVPFDEWYQSNAASLIPIDGAMLRYVRHAHFLPIGVQVIGIHNGHLVLSAKYDILTFSWNPFTGFSVSSATLSGKPPMVDCTDFEQAVLQTDHAHRNWQRLFENLFFLPGWPGAIKAQQSFKKLVLSQV